MTRPSGLLSAQVDPAALYYLAKDYVRAVGDDAALARADYYATAAKAMGENGNDLRQAAGAIYEAVEIRQAVRRDSAA